VRPDGRFIYEYRVATGVETGDYNIVRHGAVYSIDAPGEAVLGATGLGVVALLAADQLAPRTIDPAMLRALGNFLIYMQRSDAAIMAR
jgi:hypothetical protein